MTLLLHHCGELLIFYFQSNSKSIYSSMLNSCFTVNGNRAGYQQTKSFPMLHFVFAAAFTILITPVLLRKIAGIFRLNPVRL